MVYFSILLKHTIEINGMIDNLNSLSKNLTVESGTQRAVQCFLVIQTNRGFYDASGRELQTLEDQASRMRKQLQKKNQIQGVNC